MKNLRYLLIGLALGGVMGWALGYLRFPYVDQASAFGVGGLAALVGMALIVAMLYAWNNRDVLRSIVGDTQVQSDKGRKFAAIFAICFILVTMISSAVIFKQQTNNAAQQQRLNEQLQAQAEIIKSLEVRSQQSLIGNVLQELDRELGTSPSKTLSDGLIARVVALSTSLKPYRAMVGDSLSKLELSPERGQLLQSLCAMDIDSLSFARIKREATFAHADVQRAHLEKADLSYANLQGANLRDAHLQGANLQGSDLRKARVMVSIRDHEADREAMLRVLKRHAQDFNQYLAANVKLKYIPRLRFMLDESIAAGDKVLQILSELDEGGKLRRDLENEKEELQRTHKEEMDA